MPYHLLVPKNSLNLSASVRSFVSFVSFAVSLPFSLFRIYIFVPCFAVFRWILLKYSSSIWMLPVLCQNNSRYIFAFPFCSLIFIIKMLKCFEMLHDFAFECQRMFVSQYWLDFVQDRGGGIWLSFMDILDWLRNCLCQFQSQVSNKLEEFTDLVYVDEILTQNTLARHLSAPPPKSSKKVRINNRALANTKRYKVGDIKV